MPRIYKSISWREAEEKYKIDIELMYYRRLSGETFGSLSGHMSITLLKRLLKDWCNETGHDFDLVTRRKCRPIFTDARLVDKGKVLALRKAKWSVEDIAYDCNCTEDCVKEIIDGTTK